jgi:hypothetical protein
MPRPKKEIATQEVINDEGFVMNPPVKEMPSDAPKQAKVEKRFFQVKTTKEIFCSDDFQSERAFNAYLKSKNVIKLESINGSPVIATSGMDYIANKIAELDAREKLLEQKEKQK